MVEVLQPPIEPMLAKPLGHEVPGGAFLYQPKWDGFRVLAFRDASGTVLQSRSGEDISYAFPEIVTAFDGVAVGTVVDGELVVISNDEVDFGSLSQRLRPRSEVGGNIASLAAKVPATFVGFDVLATAETVVMEYPAAQRHDILAGVLDSAPGCLRTPTTESVDTARSWYHLALGAGLDGLIVRAVDGTYQPGVRALGKVKPRFTADVVVAGWRPYKRSGPNGPIVGSLLLGLHDADGRLHYVGGASSFPTAQREQLMTVIHDLEPDSEHPWLGDDTQTRKPDAPSRWRRGQSNTRLIRPELVAEVAFDGVIDGRFRHAAKWQRWRPDRTPGSCTYDQLPHFEATSVTEILTLK